MKSDLTTQEQTNVRLGLKFLQIRIGSREQLAKALHVSESSFDSGRQITASLAFKVARFAKVSIDDLLAGKFPPAGTCPYCGHCAAADEPVGVIISARAEIMEPFMEISWLARVFTAHHGGRGQHSRTIRPAGAGDGRTNDAAVGCC